MRILIADPDASFVRDFVNGWSLPDTDFVQVSREDDLISAIEQAPLDLALIHVSFLLRNDLDVISFVKERCPAAEVIALCEQKSLPAAESAIARGAARYLQKPFDLSKFEAEARLYQQQLKNSSTNRLMENQVLDSLLGDTPEMRKILNMVRKIAPTTSTVLITGESGSGKEFLANVVHRLSKRANQPFIAVNCGAIPENIVESELFGSKKGSFTGSVADKKGLFEAAAGGTLFLDEVGELSPATQVKLLRFLQSKEIRRVGETEARYLDVRIIAATNRNLQQRMQGGDFREDLYYRLNTFHLHLPPLRERQIVIPRLISYFILKYQQEQGKQVHGLDSAAQIALSSYSYPGNIRELENIIEHAIVLSEGGIIRFDDLPETVQQQSVPEQKTMLSIAHAPDKSLPATVEPEEIAPEDKIVTLAELERQYIIHALAVLKNCTQDEIVAKLGISRATLWRKLKEYKIDPKL